MSKKNKKNTVNENKKNNKTKKKIKLNENFWALIIVSISLILNIIVSMQNIGFIGHFIKVFILAIFSKFFYVLSITAIILGIYKLIFHNTYTFKKLNKIDLIIFLFMIMFIYVSFNISQLQENNTLSINNIQNIILKSKDADSIGLLPYILSIIFYKLIGKIGIILFVLFSLLYLSIKYQKDNILFILGFSKNKIKYKLKRKESLKQRKIDNLNDKTKYDNLDYIQDNVSFDTYKKQKKELLRYEFDTDFDDIRQDDIINQDESYTQDIVLDSNIQDFKFENQLDGQQGNLSSMPILENINYQDTSALIEDEYFEDISLSTDKENMQEKKDDIKKIYQKPTMELLNEYKKIENIDKNEKIKKAQALTQTLSSFGVEVKVENIATGPTITRYELKPKIGTKVSKITNLTEDLALALAAKSIRIEAPIPGKSYIGVEVPNEFMQTVSFREVIQSSIDKKNSDNIVFAMGKDISGETIVSDIIQMPHAIIAGATGSGKSVCINTIICSIIYNYSPDEIKLILIDPKVVELSIYNKLPHLIVPVVTDMKKAPSALTWAVNEMEKRYSLFAQNKSRDIKSYNQKNQEKLPRIVIIIDELADLMMVAPKDIEEAICRLAQKARACGIHLIVATQRPSVDVITGLIKANIPTRIAFAVSSQTDSRTIIDGSGAEKLLGKGDMLYSPAGMRKPIRIQGAFLTEAEVEKITEFIKIHNPIENLQENQDKISKEIDDMSIDNDKKDKASDELYDKIVEFARENDELSVTLVQNVFSIGYPRAARIFKDLEKNGIITKGNGSKPWRVVK